MKFGILIVLHSNKIAEGVKDLISEAAPDVSITLAGGTDDDEIGSSMQKIQDAVDANTGDEILAFYDLGSSKMNLDMVSELSSKPIHRFDVALVEGAYAAATMAQVNSPIEIIENSIKDMKIK